MENLVVNLDKALLAKLLGYLERNSLTVEDWIEEKISQDSWI